MRSIEEIYEAYGHDVFRYLLSLTGKRELAEDVLQMYKLLSEHEDVVNKTTYAGPDMLQLEKRYNYLKKNGVNLYGVVVTGPTKELLKLKDAKFVTFATLGETALWNWFDPPISGKSW